MEEKRTTKKISFKQMWKISMFAFRMFIKPDKISGVFLFIIAILSRLTGMVDFLIIAKIIDIVVKILSDKGTVNAVIPYLVFLVIFNFLASLLSRIRWYLNNKMNQYFYMYANIFLYEYYKTLGVPVMEDPDKNNIINRGMQEIHQLPGLFFIFVDILTDLANVIIAGITIFYFMPKLLWVAAIWMIIRNIPEISFVKQMYQYGFINTEKLRLNFHIIGYILGKISLIELSIHNAAEYIKKRYVEFTNIYLIGWLKIRKKMFWWNTSFSFGNIFVYFWVMLNIINKIIKDRLSIGRLYFYISMVERFEGNLNSMFTDLTGLYERALRIDDAYQFFNLKPNFPDGKIQLKKFEKPPKIICSDVSFKYPNTDKLILKNLNLVIKSGEKIAIVGVNGVGKTTLIKLLLRFYQTTSGDIFIDDHNIDDLKIDTLYNNVGTLFQDFSNFGSLTAEENIFVGDIYKKKDDGTIKEAAMKADAHDFIDLYPNKYQQILSETYTGGIRPSTGQWQKIAISRLFYRNPWLVIFDEPTASIDAEAEYKIFNNIYSFFKNKTVVIISHRFSTVRNADRIILIDEGKIAEQGTHEELLKLNGKYAKAFRLQAEGYEIKS